MTMSNSIAFDRAASFYDETRAFPPGQDVGAVEALVRAGGLTQRDRVLEFGIGTGRIGLPLLPYVGQLVGLDLARPMMERLRAKPGGERVALAEADATRMPFADASFDAVLSVHVLHLIPNWQNVLDEIARVLKPGRPYIHAWTSSVHRESWWDAWNAATPPRNTQGTGVRLNEPTFLEPLGWRPLGDTASHVFNYHKTPREFLDQLRNRVWSSTWRLTDEQLAAGVAAMQAQMLRDHADLDTPTEHSTGFYARAFLPPA
jgi:SAM-dependent methyltransferase